MGFWGRGRGGDGGGRDGGDGTGGDGGGGSGWADAVRDIWGRPPWLDKKKDVRSNEETLTADSGQPEREAARVAVAEKPKETAQESDISKAEQHQEKTEKPSMLEKIVSPLVQLARKLGMNIPDRENKMIYTPEGITPEIPEDSTVSIIEGFKAIKEPTEQKYKEAMVGFWTGYIEGKSSQWKEDNGRKKKANNSDDIENGNDREPATVWRAPNSNKQEVLAESADGQTATDYYPWEAPEQKMTRVGDQDYSADQIIAANVTNNPIRSDATLPNPNKIDDNKVTETTISQGLSQDIHTPIESGEVLRPAMEAAGEMGKAITEHIIENEKLPIFPYRGLEDSKLAECTKENPKAWEDAAAAFPQLAENITVNQLSSLMKGLVRNELHYYDFDDVKKDDAAKQGETAGLGTLGFSQITTTGLHGFEQKYPQLKSFLESKGYSGPGHEARALEDPSCVPMIVASKLADLANQYRTANDKLNPQRKVEITPRSLAYGYNADVYYDPKNIQNPDFHALPIPKAKELEQLRGYEKAYPTSDERVLSESTHLRHVEEQIRTFH